MFAQVKDGMIVGLSEEKQEFFDVPVELPEDFDMEHFNRYELTEDGRLIYHDVPKPMPLRTVAEIAFAVLAEDGRIGAQTAAEHAEAFEPWQPGIAYEPSQLRRHEGRLYRCVQAHTSQDGWTPEAAPSLWALAADPEDEWPSWAQPQGAHDAYQQGDKVSHGGKHWVSTADGNVWEPGVYGWEVVEDG